MSSRIGKTFLFGGMALGATAVQNAYAATLAGFTFETLTATGTTTAATFGPYVADVGTGSAFGQHASATTVYSSPAGNGSPRSLSSNGWGSAGDNYEFRVPTTGFQDILVAYDQTRSGTGPDQFQFQYSTDGTTFTNFGSPYTLAGTAFSAGTPITATPGVNFAFDLSAINGIENTALVYFRLNSLGLNSSGGTVAAAGTNRVDNFFVTGSEIPEPASAMALVTIAGAAAMRRRRD